MLVSQRVHMGYVGLLYVALEIQWGAQKPNWSVWTTSIAWASYERMRPGVYPKPPELGAQNPNCLNPHPPGIKASRVQHLQCLLSWHLRPTQVTAGGPVFRGSFKYPLVNQHHFGKSELLMGKSTIWVNRL